MSTRKTESWPLPVLWDQRLTPSSKVRAVVANSGNANACTGEQGERDTAAMAGVTADSLGVAADQVLVLSTGIIGEHLPMDKIKTGIEKASKQLGNSTADVVAAACGLMTTDTHPKLAQSELELGDTKIHLLGMAKGAAMIGPKMATMLGVILTDAPLPLDGSTETAGGRRRQLQLHQR